MKKLFSIIGLSGIIAAMTALPIVKNINFNPVQAVQSTKYSIEDVSMLQEYIVKKRSKLDGRNYDINGDGKLNIFDLALLKRAVINEPQQSGETTINIEVNGKTLSAVLYDNPTSKAFAEKLPVTLPMLDLYGREMCYRFDEALPTDNVQYTGYEVGEIVYWPPRHSFVIMYAQNGEEFEMQKVGKIESGVEIFDGIGNVDVTFSLAKAEPETEKTDTLIAYFSRAAYMDDDADAVTSATPAIGNTASVVNKPNRQILFKYCCFAEEEDFCRPQAVCQ